MTTPKFDPRISLGHIIQLVVMLVTLVSLYSKLEVRVEQTEKLAAKLDATVNQLSLDSIRVSTMVNDYLDRHK